MKTKICRKCGIEKEINNFNISRACVDGFLSTCKECRREKNNKWIERNREHIIEYKKKYYKKKSSEIKERSKKNRIDNIEKRILIEKKYRNEHHDKILKRKKRYREDNPEKIKKQRKNHYEKNKVVINNSLKNKRDTDILFKLKCNTRGRIICFLKSRNLTKRNKTFEIVGCTPNELRNYIENQFTEGMIWKNYGFYGWHIDHKIPLDSGKTEEEIYKLCHYSNLQPLWANENFKKGKRIIKEDK